MNTKCTDQCLPTVPSEALRKSLFKSEKDYSIFNSCAVLSVYTLGLFEHWKHEFESRSEQGITLTVFNIMLLLQFNEIYQLSIGSRKLAQTKMVLRVSGF
jgi:hypothetical protein